MGNFCQTSDAYSRNSEVDIASALRGSISFGRFLSESLDWDKWSAFCQNKYLEEAKNCSVPGSVAQKKAFFEAHYKKAPSRKLSASMELENTMKNSIYERETDDSSFKKAANEDPSTGIEALEEHSFQVISPSELESADSETRFTVNKHSADKLQEKEPLKESSVANENHRGEYKKKPAASGLKSCDIHEASSKSSSSAFKLRKSFAEVKESPQSCEATRMISTERRQLLSGSLNMSINGNVIQNEQKQFLLNKVQIFEKARDPKLVCASSRSSGNLLSNIKTPAKEFTTVGPKNILSIRTQSEHKRNKTYLFQSSSERGKADAKFCPLSVNCFKSSSGRENKEQNAEPSSSCMIIEKENAESEIKKLRKNLCFKARPLPDFYHNREQQKMEIKKNQMTKPVASVSPELGRRSHSRSNAGTPLLRSSFHGNPRRKVKEEKH